MDMLMRGKKEKVLDVNAMLQEPQLMDVGPDRMELP